MKLRLFLAALALALISSGARAQIGLYVNPIVTHVGNSQPDYGPFAFLGDGNTSAVFGGVSIGSYFDIGHDPKFAFGIDLRDEFQHGNNGALLNGFLVGARIQGKAPNSVLKPYAQLSIGAGTTHSGVNPAQVTKALYKIYGGADYGLSKHIDWRVIEIGYGSVTTVSSSQFNQPTSIPAAHLLSFTTGFVFRVH